MDRKIAERKFREKFESLGLSETFEFIGRNWGKDHGRQCRVKCKKCGAEFSTYGVLEVFKGYQRHLLCIHCGSASDGKDIVARSPFIDELLEFYKGGRSVRETAEKYGVSIAQVNNFVKNAKATNGKKWKDEGAKQNAKKHLEGEARLLEYLKNGGKDFRKIGKNHKRRAVKYGCEYDPGVNLKTLIQKKGMRCAICGMMCVEGDNTYSDYYGALSPTIDHIIPMSRGGGHTWDNVQVAHAICNSLKGNKVAI